MHYQWDLEIPASTAKAEAEVIEAMLPKGSIQHVRLDFPAGCHKEAKARIVHNETQIYPTNLGQWYSGEDGAIDFDDDYTLPEDWNYFTLEGYNDDPEYSHTVTIEITVYGPWPVGEFPGVAAFLDALRRYG